MYAFDIAYDMQRQGLRELLGQPVGTFTMDASKRSPKQLFFYRPQMVRLPPSEKFSNRGLVRMERSVKIMPIGAITISVNVPFEVDDLRELVEYHDMRFTDSSSIADEQPVLFADRRGTNGVLDVVVVDFHPAIAQINFQGAPLAQRIIQRRAQWTLGQLPTAGFEFDQCTFDAFDDRPTFTGPDDFTQRWPGMVFPQTGFDPVKLLDLAQQPARQTRGAFPGLVKLPSHMCPASSQSDFGCASVGKGAIRRIAVTL